MIIFKANQIKDKDTIISLLNFLKPYNAMIDELELEEGTCEYEDACENIAEQLYEIDEALIGVEKINDKSLGMADIRMMTYWKYLKEEIGQGKLFKNLRKYSNKLLIEV